MWLPSHLKSRSFRERAEECRTLAESFRDSITRAKMLQLADDYEWMANTAQRIESSEPERDASPSARSSRPH